MSDPELSGVWICSSCINWGKMSTYMSTIEAALRRAREEDLLDTWVPPDPGTARRRAFLGVPDIQRLGEPWVGEMTS